MRYSSTLQRTFRVRRSAAQNQVKKVLEYLKNVWEFIQPMFNEYTDLTDDAQSATVQLRLFL